MEMWCPSENLGSYCAGICSQSQETTSSAIRISEDGRPEPGLTRQLCPWPLSISLLAQCSLYKMTLAWTETLLHLSLNSRDALRESFGPSLSKMMSTHVKLSCPFMKQEFTTWILLVSLPNLSSVLWFAEQLCTWEMLSSQKISRDACFSRHWTRHDQSKRLQVHVL